MLKNFIERTGIIVIFALIALTVVFMVNDIRLGESPMDAIVMCAVLVVMATIFFIDR
jgi:hypothetical protein